MSTPITPQSWARLLTQAADSHQTHAHKYIVKSNAHDYQVMDQHALEQANRATPQWQKLSVFEIVALSKDILQKAKADPETYQPFPLNKEEFKDYTYPIFEKTQQLVEARQHKRDRLRIQRGLGYFLSIVFSVAGIGIYTFRKLWQADQQFKKNQNALTKQVQEIEQNLLSDKEVNQRLAKIPQVIEEAKKQLELEELETFILEHFKKNLLNYQGAPLPIFAADIEREMTFMRKDPVLKIADSAPLPPPSEKQKITQSVEALSVLTENQPLDKKWDPFLQMAATQTSLTVFLDSLKGHLANLRADMWKEGKEMVSLKVEFDSSPIQLEIVRDENTKTIQAVHVRVETFGNIYKCYEEASPGESAEELIKKQAIHVKGSYTLTLTENNEPHIDQIAVEIAVV